MRKKRKKRKTKCWELDFMTFCIYIQEGERKKHEYDAEGRVKIQMIVDVCILTFCVKRVKRVKSIKEG